MNLSIQGPKVGVTPALRAYAEKQVGKLSRIHDGIVSVKVLMSIDSKKKKAENPQQAQMIVRLKQCGEITGKCASADLYQSLDEVADVMHNKLVRRIETHVKPTRTTPPRRMVESQMT